MADYLTLLHTSPVHVARFDHLRDRIAPGLRLTHVVREDWLMRARQDGMTAPLQAEFGAAVTGPTLCTCTTFGPLAEACGAVRIDRPMMEEAARLPGSIVLVYCVDSTATASRALLIEACGPNRDIAELPILSAWTLFEAGDDSGYAKAIAMGVLSYLARHPDTGVVILAQASMDVALAELVGIGIPVLSPAESALRHAAERYRLRAS